MSIIKTVRLVLRPFKLDDVETAHEYASDPENKYMVYLPNDTKQETERFLRTTISEWKKDIPQSYEFAVVYGGKHIGGVSVYLDESRQVGELGWIIHKDYQGNGFATEAAKAVMDFAVNAQKVKKIVAHCDYRNVASVKVMQKLGLSLERDDGVRRNKGSDEDSRDLMYSFVVD